MWPSATLRRTKSSVTPSCAATCFISSVTMPRLASPIILIPYRYHKRTNKDSVLYFRAKSGLSWKQVKLSLGKTGEVSGYFFRFRARFAAALTDVFIGRHIKSKGLKASQVSDGRYRFLRGNGQRGGAQRRKPGDCTAERRCDEETRARVRRRHRDRGKTARGGDCLAGLCRGYRVCRPAHRREYPGERECRHR